MPITDKKMAVLQQLGQEPEPLGIFELLEKLGDEFSERTVRRWLSEMVSDGVVEKFGQKRATKYAAKNRPSRETAKATGCFGSESIKIIEQVRKPIYERSPTAYDTQWLDEYQPNSTFYVPLEKRTLLEDAGRRSKKEDPAGTYAHQIFNRLLIDLSYNSSRLEGNTYSLLDTKKLLLEGSSVEGKLEEEKIMILNHKEAIRYMVDNASKLDVSEHTIFTLHFLLADGLVESQFSGKIRDYGVRIGGSTYIPFEEKKRLEHQLRSVLQKGAAIANPYEQSLFLLIHLSYLQAFADVNKRTARLSANIPLIKGNLVPLSFNDVEREDYTSAMIAVYEYQDIRPLLDLYIFSYLRTCAMYTATIKAIGFDEVRVRYRQQRRAIVRDIIINLMKGEVIRQFVQVRSKKEIPQAEQVSFVEDVLEDLKEIDIHRLAGLGVTPNELDLWLAAQKNL